MTVTGWMAASKHYRYTKLVTNSSRMWADREDVMGEAVAEQKVSGQGGEDQTGRRSAVHRALILHQCRETINYRWPAGSINYPSPSSCGHQHNQQQSRFYTTTNAK